MNFRIYVPLSIIFIVAILILITELSSEKNTQYSTQPPNFIYNPEPQIIKLSTNTKIDDKIFELIKRYFGQIIIYFIDIGNKEFSKYYYANPEYDNRSKVINFHGIKLYKIKLDESNSYPLPYNYIYLYEKNNIIIGLGFLEKIQIPFENINNIRDELIKIIQ